MAQSVATKARVLSLYEVRYGLRAAKAASDSAETSLDGKSVDIMGASILQNPQRQLCESEVTP